MINEVETHCEVVTKEAEACHATQGYTLEQSHEESMLKAEHEVLAEEGHDCQAFIEACSITLWACPFKPVGYWCMPCSSLLAMCHWLPCWLPPYNWLQQAENHHQHPPHSQCQGYQHPQLELNGGTTHLSREEWHWDQRKRKQLG